MVWDYEKLSKAVSELEDWYDGSYIGDMKNPQTLLQFLRIFQSQNKQTDTILYRGLRLSLQDLDTILKHGYSKIRIKTGRPGLQSWSISRSVAGNWQSEDMSGRKATGVAVKALIPGRDILANTKDLKKYLNKMESTLLKYMNKLGREITKLENKSGAPYSLERTLIHLESFLDTISRTIRTLDGFEDENEHIVYLDREIKVLDLIASEVNRGENYKRKFTSENEELTIIIDDLQTGESHIELT